MTFIRHFFFGKKPEPYDGWKDIQDPQLETKPYYTVGLSIPVTHAARNILVSRSTNEMIGKSKSVTQQDIQNSFKGKSEFLLFDNEKDAIAYAQSESNVKSATGLIDEKEQGVRTIPTVLKIMVAGAEGMKLPAGQKEIQPTLSIIPNMKMKLASNLNQKKPNVIVNFMKLGSEQLAMLNQNGGGVVLVEGHAPHGENKKFKFSPEERPAVTLKPGKP